MSIRFFFVRAHLQNQRTLRKGGDSSHSKVSRKAAQGSCEPVALLSRLIQKSVQLNDQWRLLSGLELREEAATCRALPTYTHLHGVYIPPSATLLLGTSCNNEHSATLRVHTPKTKSPEWRKDFKLPRISASDAQTDRWSCIEDLSWYHQVLETRRAALVLEACSRGATKLGVMKQRNLHRGHAARTRNETRRDEALSLGIREVYRPHHNKKKEIQHQLTSLWSGCQGQETHRACPSAFQRQAPLCRVRQETDHAPKKRQERISSHSTHCWAGTHCTAIRTRMLSRSVNSFTFKIWTCPSTCHCVVCGKRDRHISK